MRRLLFVLGFTTLCAGPVLAVSVWELSRVCGPDADTYCKGVGYGSPMQECLDASFEALQPDCRALVQRIRGGEKVSLF
jgi:hypothetical protein